MGNGLSGQMSDPGRTQQIANGQAPSGQTGVQTGKHQGVPQHGKPMDGTEPNTGPNH